MCNSQYQNHQASTGVEQEMKKVNQSDLTSTILTEDNLTLLTTDEVAEMLMVGKNRVYELLNKEELKGMRIGKSTWRIPKEAVLQFIREQSRL